MRNIVRHSAPLLFVIPLLVWSGTLLAEEKYRVEFFGGIGMPVDKNFEIGYPQSNVTITGKQGFKAGPQGGMRLGIDGARRWGQDYSYSYGSNTTKLSTAYGSYSFKTQFHQASSSVLFYPCGLKRRALFPYLSAGLGATFVVVGQNVVTQSLNPLTVGLPLKSETNFAFHAGGGVRLRINKRIGIRFDIKDYMSRGLRFGLQKESDNPNQSVLPVNSVFHQLSGTAGLVVHF
jgi:hypothetical protein